MGVLKAIGAIIVIFILLIIVFAVANSTNSSILSHVVHLPSTSIEPCRVINCTAYDNALWNYGESGKGWTGSDGTYSLALPNGTVMWLFDDTYLWYGFNANNDTRNQSSPYIHNSIVLERNGTFYKTLIGNRGGQNDAYIYPQNPSCWFWPGPAIISGNTIQILMGDFSSSYGFHGTYLACLYLDNLSIEGIRELQSGNIQWDQWICSSNSTLYIFGIYNNTTDAYLAKVSGNSLLGDWQYYNGNGWSNSSSDAAPFFDYVTNGYSVTRICQHYALITTDATDYPLSAFDGKIYAYFSKNITGPYSCQTLLYTTPEESLCTSYQSVFTVWTYGPHVQSVSLNHIILSYNVNAISNSKSYNTIPNASIYRPRFIEIFFKA